MASEPPPAPQPVHPQDNPHPRGSPEWEAWWRDFHEAAAEMLEDDARTYADLYKHKT